MGAPLEKWSRYQLSGSASYIEMSSVFANLLIDKYMVVVVCASVYLLAVLRGARVTSREVMLLVASISAFVFFVWGRTIGARYGLNVILPVLLIGVVGIGYFVSKTPYTKRTVIPVLSCVAIGFCVFQIVTFKLESKRLTGMDRVAESILAERHDARVLYSGPRDAAFVFFIRVHDVGRRAFVSRASVQVTRESDIADFVEEKSIDFVVIEEGDDVSRRQPWRAFSGALMEYIAERSSSWRTYSEPVRYGHEGDPGVFHVRVSQLVRS